MKLVAIPPTELISSHMFQLPRFEWEAPVFIGDLDDDDRMDISYVITFMPKYGKKMIFYVQKRPKVSTYPTPYIEKQMSAYLSPYIFDSFGLYFYLFSIYSGRL